MSTYPRMVRLRQNFDPTHIEDVPGEVDTQLGRLSLGEKIKPGQSVAITVGSRGIMNIREIVKAMVDHLKSLGAAPLIVPAMGSHGGGTAEGQRGVVESYGVTEEFCGCPIRAGMETVVVCQTAEGFPVHFDRYAYEADHVIVCNRVKSHTRFAGEIESGLMKMMLIGLGKHEGAKIYHRAIQDYSFDQIVRSVASEVIDKCGIVAGLAIVENGYDQTTRIEAVAPEGIQRCEKELLALSKRIMPRLPFDEADVLIVDRIGKNISGTGMDTNVIGRKHSDHEAAEGETPRIKWIVVRDLTDETHGNATGIGMCEFCTKRVVRKADMNITGVNCTTAGHPTAAMIPIHYDTDREVLDVVLSIVGLTEPVDAKVVRILNTADLAELECSEAYLDAVRTADNLEVLGEPREMEFDAEGNLPPLPVESAE